MNSTGESVEIKQPYFTLKALKTTPVGSLTCPSCSDSHRNEILNDVTVEAQVLLRHANICFLLSQS